MRAIAMVTGLALVLAACGGKKDETTTTETKPADGGAMAPTTGGAHVVQMVQEGTTYKFVPAELTIKAGESVEFKSVSGMMHNVVFYADSIPPGAAAVLDAAMPNKTTSLTSEMVNEGTSLTVSFAGAPAGDYRFYCMPHMAMGMKGKITVTQ